MTPRVAAAIVVALFILHQDFWFWRTAHPIVFGVFPIGLFYHVAYMLVTAGVLWLLVRRLWPSHLESLDPGSEGPRHAPSAHGAQDRP